MLIPHAMTVAEVRAHMDARLPEDHALNAPHVDVLGVHYQLIDAVDADLIAATVNPETGEIEFEALEPFFRAFGFAHGHA